jgi:LysR family transcriptional regulator, regulator of abg operon
MRLSQLRDFVSIVEAGSIRAAARAHGVSHPAMTKSLRTLEQEVGVPLLRRNTRGVVCTPAGSAFLARARAIGAELRKARDDLADLKSPGGGTVSAGFLPQPHGSSMITPSRGSTSWPSIRIGAPEARRNRA